MKTAFAGKWRLATLTHKVYDQEIEFAFYVLYSYDYHTLLGPKNDNAMQDFKISAYQ